MEFLKYMCFCLVIACSASQIQHDVYVVVIDLLVLIRSSCFGLKDSLYQTFLEIVSVVFLTVLVGCFDLYIIISFMN